MGMVSGRPERRLAIWSVFVVVALAVASCRSADGPAAPEGVEGVARAAITDPFVARGSVWRYYAGGNEPGTSPPDAGLPDDLDAAAAPRWFAPGFDDGAWASGPASLGYASASSPQPTTKLPSLVNGSKLLTAYFRRTFLVTDRAAVEALQLNVLRDVGVVVYLNGVEIARDKLPAGPVGYDTLATAPAIGTADFSTNGFRTVLGPELLVDGVNVVAVEVHQESAGSSDIAFDLELYPTEGLVRGPYLQNGTPTSAVLRWRTARPTDSRVSVGSTPTSLGREIVDPTLTTEHEVTIDGLTPDTRYYYGFGHTREGRAVWLGGDETTFFMTLPTGARPIRIWALGDSGTKNEDAKRVRDAYAAHTGGRYTDVWLMLGDNAYDNGTDAEYQQAVFDMYPTFLRQSFLWPTIGNHETRNKHGVADVEGAPYMQMFTMPRAGEAGGVASGSERYYSFDYGDVHFINLDSMTTTGESDLLTRSFPGAMITWLQEDLAANTKRWTIAYWHHPPYTKGTHDSDKAGDYESALVRRSVLPLLEAAGVDLVLSGHSHVYERSYLLDGHYGTSATLTEQMKKSSGSGDPGDTGPYAKPALPKGNQGAVYVVAGASGKVGPGSLNHPAMRVSFSRLGSMVIDVDGDRLDARYLRDTGFIDDQFTIYKGTENALPKAVVTAPAAGASVAEGTTVPLAATVTDDGAITKVEFYRTPNVLVGTDTTPPFEAAFTAGAPGSYQIVAVATDDRGARAASTPVALTVTSATAATLVARGSTWRYLDDGSIPALQWRAPAFDASAWKEGPAQLGFGDGDEATVVGFGPNAQEKHITTYFRRTFSVTDPAAHPALTLRVLRDDAAIVYVNGVEVHRTNLPLVVDERTRAVLNVNGADENRWHEASISPTLLVPGENVVAVEVHQDVATSSDLSFDLELVGAATPVAPPPPFGLAAQVASPRRIDLTWVDNAATEAGFRIERAAGISTTFAQVGSVAAGVTSFSATDLQPDTTYTFRVRAFNAAGSSDASPTAAARTLACAAEACNGVDDDCDGQIDETFAPLSCGIGACARTVPACSAAGPQTCAPGQPAPEACNGIDDDCDGVADEELGTSSCGVGACARTVATCAGGQAQACTPGAPGAELCNGVDDDCDGAVDEELGALRCGVGACARSVSACAGLSSRCSPRSNRC